MNKELKFDLSVETNALLCPNPIEFYSKAYITENIVDNFRTLPGIKSATKLANQTFTNVLTGSTCDFGTNTSSLNAIDVDVCAVSALAELCQFDLEASFVSLQMAQGSNGNYQVAEYMSYYWDVMSKEISEEIELIRWTGDLTGATNSFLDLCDGYEVILDNDAAVVDVAATATTTANVIDHMTAVVNAMPDSIKSKRGELRFHVSSDIALKYEIAAALGNTASYITQSLGLSFLGIKVVVNEGMSSNKMVLTRKDNLIYAFDGEGDSKALEAVDLSKSVAEPKLRTRTNMKMGFVIANPTEIVYFS
jgi:hypothetical protein